jgi:hypothetical protein
MSGHEKIGENRIDEKQLALLRKCAAEGDAREWNRWRETNPDVEINLQGATIHGGEERPVLRRINLRGANLARAKLQGAVLVGADLRDALLTGAMLRGAILVGADLRGARVQEADLRGVNLRGADLRRLDARYANLDGETLFLTDRIDRDTNFAGTPLGSARIEPGLQQLLEYNVRRDQWQRWYRCHRWLALPVYLFWLVSDYGKSTGRIILSFLIFVFAFAAAYTLVPDALVTTWARGPGEALSFGYALYFSVVTMTTLGFGDAYASPYSTLGQFLLSVQVMLGYFLLGALITRFAVLFTAGGPSASFYRE